MLDLIPPTDKILHTKLELFDFKSNTVDPKKLYEEMKQTLIMNNGIGLACNQVGLPYRMFVMIGPEDYFVSVFNPRIIEVSNETEYDYEGCLSYPEFYVKVKRPTKITVRFFDEKGVAKTLTYEGTYARRFLHEYDHLDGITFHQRATKYHLDKAGKNRRKIKL